MPRYLIERTFKDGPETAMTGDEDTIRRVVANNAEELVTWIHSYISLDKTKAFCLYEGPSPEAVRRAAAHNDLPIDRITEVRVLDPYAYYRRS